ncbi:hypothetical protein ACH5RR_006802 [Cinchona calisaya]|uniref:Reverse transcriptase zinc-binding domain-containing protein n=1 Tax=Cinchona calisaya TaxID=153742 RepID=A0ABD3AQ08_9GENT
MKNFLPLQLMRVLCQNRNKIKSLEYICSAQILIKVLVFLWKLLNRFLPFANVLLEFGFALPSKCYFCNSLGSLDHFFVHCHYVKNAWGRFESIISILRTEVSSPSHKLQSWWLHLSSSIEEQLMLLLPTLICW